MATPRPGTFWPATEIRLIRRLANVDDHPAWTAFVARYQPPIWRAARRAGLTEAEAEEVVQKTFIAVHRSLATYQPERGRFRTWLGGIVRHRILEQHRERRRWPQPLGREADTLAAGEPSGSEPPGEPYLPFEEEAERELDARAWERLKEVISPAHWQVLRDLVLLKYTPAEVGQKYGFRRGTVYVIKLRCLPKLRAVRRQLELEEELGVPGVRAGEQGRATSAEPPGSAAATQRRSTR